MKEGSLIPETTLLRSNGEPVQLTELVTGPMLLIFLRHLA
jgi:hypothetical protein